MFVGLMVVALLSTGILLLFWLLDCDSCNNDNAGSLELLVVESEVVALLLPLENSMEGTMGGKDVNMLLVFDGGADSCCC